MGVNGGLAMGDVGEYVGDAGYEVSDVGYEASLDGERAVGDVGVCWMPPGAAYAESNDGDDVSAG